MTRFFDLLPSIGSWLPIAIGASPIILATCLEIWEGVIRPRFVPREEIDRLACETCARYPDDPEHAAFREEEYYWYRSDSFERAKWRRVRREIQRRLGTPRDEME